MYAPGMPDRPHTMSAAARPFWDELIAEMASAAILRRVDKRALAHLAEDEALLACAYEGIWSMARDIKRAAKAQGKRITRSETMVLLLTNAKGRMAMSAVGHLAGRVIIERREFGLTPSSRTRIDTTAGEGGPVDALELKLCG
jgi:phage terminase small subunit